MTIDYIVALSKAIKNSHTITQTQDAITIGVAKNNKWKLLIIGLIALTLPTLISNFIPFESESDLSFFKKLQFICYAMPVLLLIVYFLQNKQKTVIQTVSKVITYKKQTITPEEVVSFEIEHFRKRQLHAYSIYLTTKTNQKVLIGATTSCKDEKAMEKYAQAVLNYIQS